MRRLKIVKLVLVMMILVMVVTGFTYKVKADDEKTTNNIEIYTTNANPKKGEEFEVLVISNKDLNMGSITADIKLDTEKLEFVESEEAGSAKVEINDTWTSVIVGIQNSKLSAVSSQKVKAGEEVCKIKLRAIKNITLKNDSIKLENISIVEGNYEKQEIQEVKLSVDSRDYMIAVYIITGVCLIAIAIVVVVIIVKRKNKEK